MKSWSVLEFLVIAIYCTGVDVIDSATMCYRLKYIAC